MKNYCLTIFTIALVSLSFAVSADSADKPGDKKQMMAMMKHVSPMPSLMPVVIKNADLLELSKEQTEALAKERKKRHAQVHTLASEIMADESKILQATLDGKPKAEIHKMSQAVMDKRLIIIDAKAGCRDIVRKALNDEQWNELLVLYKQNNE